MMSGLRILDRASRPPVAPPPRPPTKPPHAPRAGAVWRRAPFSYQLGVYQLGLRAAFGIIRDSFQALFGLLRRHHVEHPIFIGQNTATHRRLQDVISRRPLVLPAWLVDPYAQTMMAALLAPKLPPDSSFVVEVLHSAKDGAPHALAWLTRQRQGAPDEPLPPDAPVVFCAHGLGGSHESSYVGYLTELCARRRWRLVVHVRRGHLPWAATDVTPTAAPTYTSLDDTIQAVAAVCDQYPGAARRFAVGISAGGNAIAMYMGATGAACRFDAGIVLSCNGCDIKKGMPMLSPLAHKVLLAYMYRTHAPLMVHDCELPPVLPPALPPLEPEPEPEPEPELEPEPRAAAVPVVPPASAGAAAGVCSSRISRISSLREFDALFHADVDEYHQDHSAARLLPDVRKPLLCVTAMDDPIIPGSVLQSAIDAAMANEHISIIQTQAGGHVGWLTSAAASWKLDAWWVDVVEDVIDSWESGRGDPVG